MENNQAYYSLVWSKLELLTGYNCEKKCLGKPTREKPKFQDRINLWLMSEIQRNH
jgi:hypothetical protein